MSIASSLMNAAGALDAFSRVMDVTQNNVTNASTPGYAKQTAMIEPLSFDLTGGAVGGVRAGEIVSSRNQYAEQTVRRAATSLGQAQQDVASLTSAQSVFDIADDSGLTGALNTLFSNFSAWAQTPTGPTTSQAVIDSAGNVARAFQQTYQALTNVRDDTESQLKTTVSEVNQLTAQLANLNAEAAQSSGPDAGVDAQINSTLEQLSQYAGITAMPQSDGSYNVLLDGQIPLVLGSRQYQLSCALNPGAPQSATILSNGADVTKNVDGGQLGSLLNTCNSVLPAYLGDSSQPGGLNVMAQQFADSVNGILSAGTPGLALFDYDATSANTVAQTLAVDPSVTAAQLTAVPVSVPLSLSGLESEGQDALGGSTFSEYYGQMASGVGAKLSAATGAQTTQQSTLAQAQNLRQQSSGVSLDEEAMILIEFQRAYEANSKMVTLLDQIMQDTINMLPTS